MPVGPARMPLMDHLGELRRRLTIVIVSVVVAAIVMYFATPVVVDILTDPIKSFVPHGKFYITTTLGGFSLRFSIAVKLGVVMCTPMIIWQIFGFFLPALRPNERKWVVPTVFAAVVLFFLGAIFCYFVIIPAGFQWLIGETNAVATTLPDLENYINIEMLFMIGFGVAFELPLIIFYLIVFHIVSYASFRSAWRYIYVGLLVASAIITPDGSPVTLGLLFGALISLYEISLFIARMIIVARDGKKGLFESRLSFFGDDDDDEDEDDDE